MRFSPSRRVQKAPVWKYLKRIVKHNVFDREMKTDCTHICVHQLSDDEGGSKRYCNRVLKIFRDTKRPSSGWRTSTALEHFKKEHPHSDSVRKHKAKLEIRQVRLGESMHVSDSSSQRNTYGLSDNEKVLSAIDRWGTYASMKVWQHNLRTQWLVRHL